MLSVVRGAVASGLLLVSQTLGMSAETVSISFEGNVDFGLSGLNDVALIDGEAFALSFNVDSNALLDGGLDTSFLLGDPVVEFAQSGVSIAFPGASAQTSQATASNASPVDTVASIRAEDTDLFLEIDFAFEAPSDSSLGNILVALEDAEFSTSLFTFANGSAAIGSCSAGIFCGINEFGPANISLVSDDLTAGVTPVPLPAGIWLLLSGLGLAGAMRGLRRSA